MRFLSGLALTLLGTALATACDKRTEGTEDTPVIEYEKQAYLEDDGLLHDVRDMVIGQSGGMWVLTGSEPFLYHYAGTAPSMELVISFGARGDGPSDLLNPWKLFLREGQAGVDVWDPGNRKLVWASPQARIGSPRSFVVAGLQGTRANIRDISYGDPYKAFKLDNGILLALYEGGVLRTGDFRGGRIVRVDSGGAQVATLFDFRQLAPPPSGTEPQQFVDIPLWHLCGDRLAVFDPTVPAVHWLDLGGNRVATIRLRLERRPLVEQDLRRYLRHMATLELRGAVPDSAVLERQLDQILAQSGSQFPSDAPYFVRMLCDADGGAWLQRFDTGRDARGYAQDWLVIGRDARSKYGVRFPRDFEPMVVSPLNAWGVATDSLGVQRIAHVEAVR